MLRSDAPDGLARRNGQEGGETGWRDWGAVPQARRPSTAIFGCIAPGARDALPPLVRRIAWGLLLLVLPVDAHAAPSPALVLELIDAEPVGVRVTARPFKGNCHPELGTPVFEGVLKKNAPIGVATDAYRLCISQTSAPFVNVGYGPALAVQHVAGLPPIPIRLRSRGVAGAPAVPSVVVSPLVLVLADDGKVGVRVAAGSTGPCDASVNVPLFRGVLEPQKPRSIETDAMCVCVEQTFAPFTTAGFGAAQIRCRPTDCLGKWCQTNVAAPFVVSLTSHP